MATTKTAAAVEPEVHQQAQDVQHQIEGAVTFIRSTHQRISGASIEIGQRFYDVKRVLDAVLPDVRRVNKIPRFSTWMNEQAPDLCGMSKRAAWSYYASFAEAAATGLQDKTIVALAPSLLKTEKSRSLVLTALVKRPELVEHLNEVAKQPRELKKLAESDEMKSILRVLEPRETITRADRVSRAIVNAYEPVLNKDRTQTNEVLEELSAAVNGAVHTLGLGSYFQVTITKALQAQAPPGVTDLPLPANQQEAIEQLSKLIQSGSAKVVAVGR